MTKTRKIKRDKRSHSEQRIADTLTCLVMNNYNYNKTSKETGISRGTIYGWASNVKYISYMNDINIQQVVDNSVSHPKIKTEEQLVAAKASLEKASIYQPDIMMKVYRAKDMAMDKIITLIPKSKSLTDLIAVIRELSNLTGDVKQPNINNFFTQINQTLKEKGYGKAEDNNRGD